MKKEPHLTAPTLGKSYYKKRDIQGEMVSIADSRRENRGMELIIQKSRALSAGQIHELAVTSKQNISPGSILDSVAYLGMMEIKIGGLIVIDDEVIINGELIGKVTGFDETHYPNHINIIIRVNEMKTGHQMGLDVGTNIKFVSRFPK